MAATLHELEIEIEKIKIELSILRRDMDTMMNNKQEVTKADTSNKPTNDAGENIK